VLAYGVFISNPNILYLQATPMTEMVLLVFLILSTYYFLLFLQDDKEIKFLVVSALFGFCASISRYEGWFLVVVEAGIIIFYYLKKKKWARLQGMLLLFSTAAFLGIFLWFLWDFLILGDPLYFTNSQFSAKSQQQTWLSHGQLPAYHNIILSLLYYLVTAMANAGTTVFILSAIGLFWYFCFEKNRQKDMIILVLLVPFIFYVVTLYIGQSVIFIPDLTPANYSWSLFNVRYGVIMLPAVVLFLGYLFYRSDSYIKVCIVGLICIQNFFFYNGTIKIITYEDGVRGLSHARRPDAENWMKDNYTNGLVLLDDYARTISIIRSGVPMQDIIYIGNHPYWDESLTAPEKYAKWIVMQKNDEVWKHVYEDKTTQARLYKYFKKVYTSNEILIFERNDTKLSRQ
jgi:hypothetical protein